MKGEGVLLITECQLTMDFIYGILPFLPEDNPILFWGIIIVLVLIVVSIVRALFKLAFVLLVIAIIAVAVFGYSPLSVMETGKTVFNESKQYVEKSVIPTLNAGIKKTDVKVDANGQKTIAGKGFTISVSKDGKPTIHLESNHKTLSQTDLEKNLDKEQFETLMRLIEKTAKQ